MEITDLCKKAHESARGHGFWEDHDITGDITIITTEEARKQAYNNAIGNRLMLIVSEVAEALEGLRKNDMENFEEEIADIFIRLGDLCGGLEIDIEPIIEAKMEKNKNRPYKHGKEF